MGKAPTVPGLARANLRAVGACLCISTVQRPLWNCLCLALLTRLVPFFFVPPQRPLCLPPEGPTIDHRFSRTRLLGKLPLCLLPEACFGQALAQPFILQPLFAVLQTSLRWRSLSLPPACIVALALGTIQRSFHSLNRHLAELSIT